MLIYKIFRTPEWDALQSAGETLGAPVDVTDGYIHFSTAETVEATAQKYFAGEDGLWLLGLESEALGETLIWEPARGGILFPHLYRALRLEDVLWAKPLPREGERHIFPEF